MDATYIARGIYKALDLEGGHMEYLGLRVRLALNGVGARRVLICSEDLRLGKIDHGQLGQIEYPS